MPAKRKKKPKAKKSQTTAASNFCEKHGTRKNGDGTCTLCLCDNAGKNTKIIPDRTSEKNPVE